MIAPIIRVSTYIHVIDNTLERFSIFFRNISNYLDMFEKSEIELSGYSYNESTNQLAHRFLRNGFSGGEPIESVIGLYYRLTTMRKKLEDIPGNHFVLMNDSNGRAFTDPLEYLFLGVEFQLNSSLNITHISSRSTDKKASRRASKR